MKHPALAKVLLLVIAVFSTTIYSRAQKRDINIVVGDSLVLNRCSNKDIGFLHIDIVVKTRWVNRGLTYNKETGEGFYDYFFNEGDFDSKRLPCSYAGRKFRIANIQQYNNDDGSTRTVIIGQIDNEHTVLWIELDKAIQDKEIVL